MKLKYIDYFIINKCLSNNLFNLDSSGFFFLKYFNIYLLFFKYKSIYFRQNKDKSINLSFNVLIYKFFKIYLNIYLVELFNNNSINIKLKFLYFINWYLKFFKFFFQIFNFYYYLLKNNILFFVISNNSLQVLNNSFFVNHRNWKYFFNYLLENNIYIVFNLNLNLHKYFIYFLYDFDICLINLLLVKSYILEYNFFKILYYIKQYVFFEKIVLYI